ncbi:hypothetical protein ABK040_013304 [Willaertia magna]
MAKFLLSNNEKNFILQTLEPSNNNTDSNSQVLRIDGRNLYDYRNVEFKGFSDNLSGQVQVSIGNTIALGIVSCSIQEPYPERPNEGFLQFQTIFSLTGSKPVGTKQTSQQRETCIEIARVIDRSLRGSKAIDTEALCIIPGRKVWSLKVNIYILQDDGNVFDCCHLAAISSLLHFRRPEITIEGNNHIVIHSNFDRQPVPLSIHHFPICCSFCFFESNSDELVTSSTLFSVDPIKKEELIASGSMTIALNTHKELCAIQKGGGLALTKEQILECTNIAAVKVKELTELLKSFLKREEELRKISRMNPLIVEEDSNDGKVVQGDEEEDGNNNMEEDDTDSDVSDELLEDVTL